MNDEIKRILADLTVDGVRIPCVPLRYRGGAKKFVTWTVTSDEPALSADDVCAVFVTEIDVDIYSDTAYHAIARAIMARFKAAGWVWTGNGPEMYEEDTGLYHRTLSFQIERMD